MWQHSDMHAWTEHTIVDEDAFSVRSTRVRQLGYALDNEENEAGVRCIVQPPFRTTADARPTRFRCLRRSAA